jgi:hypothetical protein
MSLRLATGWENQDGRAVWLGDGLEPCYYCGHPADTIDHVVPRNLLARKDVLDGLPDLGIDLVPACRVCNSGLGGRFFESLGERKAAAKEYLKKRYRKLLCAPRWTDDEVEELPLGKLRDYIAQAELARGEVEKMIKWERVVPKKKCPSLRTAVRSAGRRSSSKRGA